MDMSSTVHAWVSIVFKLIIDITIRNLELLFGLIMLSILKQWVCKRADDHDIKQQSVHAQSPNRASKHEAKC